MSYKIPANIIRQWCFCPRVVYYRELLNLNVSKPLWVQQGEDKHLSFHSLIRRRNFANLGIEKGRRHFNVYMEIASPPLLGIADLVVECKDAVYPIDYKSGNRIYRGQIMQMAAYCLMAQEKFNKAAPYGIFLYGNQGKLSKVVEITAELKEDLGKICEAIERTLANGAKPHSDAGMHQCIQCEYLNHCNDRGE